MSSEPVRLRTHDLRVGSAESFRVHVRDLAIGPGVTALVGRNGAGKTTLMAALARDVSFAGDLVVSRDGSTITDWPAAGDVTIVDHEASAPPWWRVDRCLGFAEWIAASDRPAVTRDAVVVELELGGLLQRWFRTLSAGEAQRVALAMGLLQDSSLYLLDEPTGNVDLALAPRIGRLLSELGSSRTVIVATHDLALLRALQARVVWLERGEVHADTAELGEGEARRLLANLDELLERL